MVSPFFKSSMKNLYGTLWRSNPPGGVGAWLSRAPDRLYTRASGNLIPVAGVTLIPVSRSGGTPLLFSASASRSARPAWARPDSPREETRLEMRDCSSLKSLYVQRTTALVQVKLG